MDGQGRIWVVEHGARGGDEVNLIRPGANYGWPVIAYGRHYSGAPIGIGTQAEGMQQPYFYWDPSIAPSGAAFYQGDLFPDWQGDMLVGALSGGVIRLRPGPNMHEIGRIETHETARVRDVRVAPDGAIWVLSVGNGALYRITPASQ
jgi:glucose/arabinose dehydrogenase